MAFRYEIRISGTGGQGVILAAIILAEAAAAKPRSRRVVQTVHYGPQVRGGLSNAELVISDEEIDFPLPMGLDLLVPFTQQAVEESAPLMKQDGMIIHDPLLAPKAWGGWLAHIPLTQLAENTTGKRQHVNIVALGAVSALCPHVDSQSLNAALKARAPEGLVDTFLKEALVGRKAAQRIKEHIHFEGMPSIED